MKQQKEIENVQLRFDCPQDWDSMTVCGNNRYCTVCQKIVYDFTDKSQADYEAMLRQHNGKLCGRFQATQMKPRSALAKAVALVALSLVSTEGIAQQLDAVSRVLQEKTVQRDTSDFFIGVVCEPQPEFIGGPSAMFRYLSEHFCYPESARENGIEGTIYVGSQNVRFFFCAIITHNFLPLFITNNTRLYMQCTQRQIEHALT